MAKEYSVVKDGLIIKTYKSLSAAKQLADKEEAAVRCDGTLVYESLAQQTENAVVADVNESAETTESVEPVTTTTEEAPAETPAADATEKAAGKEPKTATRYRLLSKMNVRKAPSLKADKLKVLGKGTVVEVESIVDDWMHLTDGTFILYGGGEFAQKA